MTSKTKRELKAMEKRLSEMAFELGSGDENFILLAGLSIEVKKINQLLEERK